MSSYGSPPDPPSRDDDGVTFLPVDRAHLGRIPFGPTDLRGATPLGGIRLGKSFVFLLGTAMPGLEASQIAQACDQIVKGQDTYKRLLYLSRARPEDLPAIFEASQSFEIRVRWERLWVLSSIFARLARHPDGQEALLKGFEEDLAGVHLLSKFVEQNNPAIKRLFSRLHDKLLRLLLKRLVEYEKDPRRIGLLAGIIATFETQQDVIVEAMPKGLSEMMREKILAMLYTTPGGNKSRLSASTLRDKLQGWRRDLR